MFLGVEDIFFWLCSFNTFKLTLWLLKLDWVVLKGTILPVENISSTIDFALVFTVT